MTAHSLKRRMRFAVRKSIFLGAAGFVSCITYLSANTAHGGVVRYEWSGTIVPNDVSDPWLIGPGGSPFTLQATVQGNAPDLAAVSLEISLFDVGQARLFIAGQEISFIGEGILEFSENSIVGYDLLTFQGIFERNGIESLIASVVGLPPDTFQFLATSGSPPAFGSVANVLKSSTGGPLYGAVVESGTAVFAVPEPSVFNFLAMSLLWLVSLSRISKPSLFFVFGYRCRMSRPFLFALFVFFAMVERGVAQNQVVQTEASQVDNVGIELLNPNSSFSTLNYQRGNNATNKDKMALIRINFIGDGPNHVPEGSTIVSATLRLRAIAGGDGIMWRAANPWSSSSTWNSFGGSSLNHFLSPSEGIGLNTEQGKEFDVTEEVERWMDGEANQGWVLKGDIVDCTSSRVYSKSSASYFPRLTVIFVPPDTTPPRITEVFFASSYSGHPDYVVPVGSGARLKTIPIGGINRIYIGFSENVSNISADKFSVTSANSSTSYPFTVGAAIYNGLPYAVINLTNPLPSDQVIVTAFSTLKDAANNSLDGDWSPKPTSINSTGTDAYPSGNGSAGGDFEFYATVLRSDFNHDNKVDSADRAIWSANFGASGATHGQGDADGDGAVTGSDLTMWQGELGRDYTTW